MKFAILFALVASVCAGTSVVGPVFYNAAQSSPGFISGGNFYSGSSFVYPGSQVVPTTYSAVAPGNFAFRSAVVPSGITYQSAPAAAITYSGAPVATTYSVAAAPVVDAAPVPVVQAIVPQTIAQTKGSSHITYSGAPVATTYSVAAAPVPVVQAIAPKTIAQTKGSSHITY